jgi:hypothetical protein
MFMLNKNHALHGSAMEDHVLKQTLLPGGPVDLAGHGREPFGVGRAGDRPDTRRLGAAARGQLGHGRQQKTAQELLRSFY